MLILFLLGNPIHYPVSYKFGNYIHILEQTSKWQKKLLLHPDIRVEHLSRNLEFSVQGIINLPHKTTRTDWLLVSPVDCMDEVAPLPITSRTYRYLHYIINPLRFGFPAPLTSQQIHFFLLFFPKLNLLKNFITLIISYHN